MNYVNLTIEQGIGTVEFFTEQSNALPSEILEKLANTITEAGKNDEIKVIVLKSGGNRTFCAGASFDELLSIQNEEEGLKFFMGFANVIQAMRKAPKFIIGRVQGKAVGGGVGIASACDYCFASKYASIKLSELTLGIGPFVISPAVERKIGLPAFSQMSINATEFYSPEWAKSQGLYAEIFENTDDMDEKVKELASKLATYHPAAMQKMKQVLWQNTDNWDELLLERAAISGKLVLSDFTKNFIQQFKNN